MLLLTADRACYRPFASLGGTLPFGWGDMCRAVWGTVTQMKRIYQRSCWRARNTDRDTYIMMLLICMSRSGGGALRKLAHPWAPQLWNLQWTPGRGEEVCHSSAFFHQQTLSLSMLPIYSLVSIFWDVFSFCFSLHLRWCNFIVILSMLPVCPWHISRTVHPIKFTLGSAVLSVKVLGWEVFKIL